MRFQPCVSCRQRNLIIKNNNNNLSVCMPLRCSSLCVCVDVCQCVCLSCVCDHVCIHVCDHVCDHVCASVAVRACFSVCVLRCVLEWPPTRSCLSFFLRTSSHSLTMRPQRIHVSSSRWDRLEEAEELDTSDEPLFLREPLTDRRDLWSVSSNLTHSRRRERENIHTDHQD